MESHARLRRTDAILCQIASQVASLDLPDPLFLGPWLSNDASSRLNLRTNYYQEVLGASYGANTLVFPHLSPNHGV
jgi:hypothetical protein